MGRALAIARLTFWEGIRMRIVLVFLVVMVLFLVMMPFLAKGDETLAGRLQTFLSYALFMLSLMLALSTSFFACATLSEEFRVKTLHMVVTKPVNRFHILLGKWLGVNALILLIIALSGGLIYLFAYSIQSRPEEFVRDRVKIDNVIWTARIAAKPTEPDFLEEAKQEIDARVADGEEFFAGPEVAAQERARELNEQWRVIDPGVVRIYEFEDLPKRTGDLVYQIRFKIRALPYAEKMLVQWAILNPETRAALQTMETEERPGETHQFLVREAAVVDGKAAIAVFNPRPDEGAPSIYFEGIESLQLLYKVGDFEENFVKTLVLTFFRMSFLAALGVFFGTFVSFPVACFCVLTIFVFCLGAPWWLESIGANMQMVAVSMDPYGSFGPWVRMLLVPILKLMLPDFWAYDGVESLIDGSFIEWITIMNAALHTIIYGLILLFIPGWLIFRFREVAEVVV